MSATHKQISSTFFLILFFTYNTLMFSYSGLKTSKLIVNNNEIEIAAEPDFFSEIKNCIDSLNKGIFIHYDYSEVDESDDNEDEEKETLEKVTKDTFSIEQDLEILKQLEKNLDKFKNGEIDQEELKITKIKIDSIMKKYVKADLSDKKIEKLEDDEEDFDKDDQDNMVKSYVREKLDNNVSNDIENEKFDEYIIGYVKRLNLLKLFTMESKMDVVNSSVI